MRIRVCRVIFIFYPQEKALHPHKKKLAPDFKFSLTVKRYELVHVHGQSRVDFLSSIESGRWEVGGKGEVR